MLPVKGQKHPSILKHYKSCPVSPVHEEVDWSNFAAANQCGNNIIVTEPPKRHSMYHEDAKTILDMIHNDTEKMIAEITEKYGDLDDFDPKRQFIPKSNSTGDMLKPKYSTSTRRDNEFYDDDGNFSSDSLEDCSLDLDVPIFDGRKAKTVCRKHSRKIEQTTTLPKRSNSDYFIYEDFDFGAYRNVSLSDILNEDEHKDNSLFNSHQRHSSASFFLSGPDGNKKSQESLLSDEFSIGGADGVSYCNSMESILSDDSECKSAPLEALFIRTKREILASHGINENRCTELTSKSYGSSPNATSGFDYYMQGHSYDMSGYGYESLLENQVTVDSSQPSNAKQLTTVSNTITPSPTFPWLSSVAPISKADEFIPRLTSNNYSSTVNKSLSKEFANHRQNCKTNPIFDCVDERYCQKKMSSQPKSTKRIDIFKDPTVYVMKKSCSFDIDMFDGRRTQRSTKKYEQNLEKFEKERKMSDQYGGTLEMDYVPHKPPPAKNRRSSSVKSKRSLRDKDRYHTVGNCESNDKHDKSSDVKSHDVYVAEKGVTENENVDTLELYAKPDVSIDNSIDLLNEKRKDIDDRSVMNSKFLTQSEYLKFKDIEKKIDVINKLVELEERKLEHERILKENRMKPFQCNSKEKGYVKSLTMNFDNLAKTLKYENDYVLTQCEQRMKRNFSLPDVLEGAKLQLFELNIDDDLSQPFEKSLFHEGVITSLHVACYIVFFARIRKNCMHFCSFFVESSRLSQ